MIKCVSILGSTGSIGRQSLDIISRMDVRVAALTAGTNVERMAEQCRQFRPELAVMATKESADLLREQIKDLNIRLVFYKAPQQFSLICDTVALHLCASIFHIISGQSEIQRSIIYI